MTKDTLERHIDSSENIKRYLIKKALTHNYYKCYSSMDRIIAIRDTKAIYIDTSSQWNDRIDSHDFTYADKNIVRFGKCFSYAKEENIAMWMLYGNITHYSGMIDFTRKGFNEILKANEIELGRFNNGRFEVKTTLRKQEFEMYATDILYFSERGDAYTVTRSDEMVRKVDKSIIENLHGCKKAYPWNYEKECRLIIEIDRNKVPEGVETVRIDLSKMDLGKSFKRIYRSPQYPCSDTYGTEKSALDGQIEWKLCKEMKEGKCRCWDNINFGECKTNACENK